MMELLTEKLQAAMKKIRGFGKLTEDNIAESLREVRLALLAADVHYQVARDFCERVKTQALGEEVQSSIKPGDLFVKIVYDELLKLFGEGEKGISEEYPLKIVLCGLNGSGKTTTAAKLALYFKRQKESVLLVAADLARPAAIEQLETLGKQIGVPVLRPQGNESVLEHVRNAGEEAKKQNIRVTIYDTAGRLEADEELLKELEQVIDAIQPQECLLVADAATGQAAVAVAAAFKKVAPLSGIILSKFDGDAKGGAALSLQSVANCPIKFLGVGEQTSALEVFQPQRLASRILGMGDVIGLVEKAQEAFELQDAEKLSQKFMGNTFNLQDFLSQLQMMKKLGPLQNLLGMIPGMDRISSSALDEKSFKQTEAIILSMTLHERRKPDVLNARRRQRIAAGCGATVADVNDLMRRFMMMKKMVSKVSRGGNMEKRLKSLFNQIKP
ncbi:MAG: signal recognition particle protein [Verrucomicrobiota bacterium]